MTPLALIMGEPAGTPGVSYLAGRIARDIRARAWRAHPARAPYDPFRA